MGVRIPFTSGWHRAVWFGSVFFINIPIFFGVIGLLSIVLPDGWGWVGLIAGFAALIVVRVLTQQPLSTLAAWLYVRLGLRVPLLWAEVKPWAWLFVPNETKKWWPMREITELPREHRRAAFFLLADRIAEELREEAC